MVARTEHSDSDIDVRLIHRPASAERDFLSGNGRLSEIATMRAMLRHQDEAMLVEAKAVDAAYPLYGTLEVENTTLAAALANATAYMGRWSSKACSTGSTSKAARL